MVPLISAWNWHANVKVPGVSKVTVAVSPGPITPVSNGGADRRVRVMVLVDPGHLLTDVDLQRRRGVAVVIEDVDHERPLRDGARDRHRIAVTAAMARVVIVVIVVVVVVIVAVLVGCVHEGGAGVRDHACRGSGTGG